MLRARFVCIAALLLAACSEGSTQSGDDAGTAGASGAGGAVSGPGDTWMSLGYDDRNTRHNRFETTLGPENVGDLQAKWLELGVQTGVTSTPAVVDGIVYFGEWGGTVRAVRAEDGSEVWRTQLDDGNASSSPLIHEDRLYISSGSKVFALAKDDGRELWQQLLDENPWTQLASSPRWANGKIIVGVAGGELSVLLDDYTFRGSVLALDADTGREVWRFYTTANDETSGGGVSVWSSAAIDFERNTAYIGTGNTYEEPASPYSDAILALDIDSGELKWHTQFTMGDVFVVPLLGPGPDADIGASPNLFTDSSGRDLVAAGSKAGLFKALDRDTGDVVWERTLGVGSALGGIMTTSATDDELIYVNSNNATTSSVTTALRIDDGSTVWERTLPAPAYGALTIANGVLFHPTTGGIALGMDTKTGDIVWTVDLVSDLAGGISVVDGTVYVPRGFSFLGTRYENAGGLVAFSLDGGAMLDFQNGGMMMPDGGPTLTFQECRDQTFSGLSNACKDCACLCNATAVGSCDERCWTLKQCVVDNCANDFDVVGCVEASCTDVKLLPQEVQDAVNASADCMVQCRNEC